MTPERYSIYRGTRWQRITGWLRMHRRRLARWLRRRRARPNVEHELYGKRAPGCGPVERRTP